MEIIAHRGASTYAPENTLAAFALAIQMGVKAVEFDVQMTKDGALVVIHDYDLNRTTNGQGYVMASTLEYIRGLNAGSWFSEDYREEKVPLLSEVLDLLPKEITTHIEIKKTAFEKRPVEQAVLSLVKLKDRLSTTIFSSFDHSCLLKLVKEPEIQIGVLVGANIQEPVSYLQQNLLASYSLNQSIEFISFELVEMLHAQGLKLLSYTVNDLSMAKMCEAIGVDGIFTNDPKILT